jgi:GNAT superfamily N-acetyltransferase
MDDHPIEFRRQAMTISTDRARLDLAAVLALLRTTFWGQDIDPAVFAKAIRNSICFGMYDAEGKLVGFGRVVTDRATYAYWSDVVTAPELRGQGWGAWLGQCMLDHPELQGLRRIGLLTRDAVALYTRLGFSTQLPNLIYMEKRGAPKS